MVDAHRRMCCDPSDAGSPVDVDTDAQDVCHGRIPAKIDLRWRSTYPKIAVKPLGKKILIRR